MARRIKVMTRDEKIKLVCESLLIAHTDNDYTSCYCPSCDLARELLAGMEQELPEQPEKKLSDDLKSCRIDRPDEWTMDRFIRKAIVLEGGI